MAFDPNYADEETELQDVALPAEALMCVGRIIRAVAEIEDVVTVYLCALAKLSDGHAVILFGRDGLAKKIDLARRFATAHGEDKLRVFREQLDSDAFKNVVEMRNVLAHGAYLGQSADGRWAFRTVKQLELIPTGVIIEAVTFGDADFEHCAMTAEAMVAEIASQLRVSSTRARRSGGKLGRHTKAPTRKKTRSSTE